MSKFVKRTVLAAPMLALVVGLAACSGKEDGNPVGGDATSTQVPGSGGGPFPTGGSGSTKSVTTSPGAGKGPLADRAPCSLLTDAEVSQVGAKPEGEKKLGYARVCEYQISGAGSLGVGIFDTLGIKDNRERQTPTQVGRHAAVRAISGANCSILLPTTESSRVDVTFVSITGDEQKSCELAMRVAQLVEPKLP